MYTRILVPTDASELSAKAIDPAIALASGLGSELVILYVAPRYPRSYLEGGATVSQEDAVRTEKLWAEKGEAAIAHAVDKAKAKGVKARSVVVKSDLVAESILATVKKEDCKLVVMASHGRKGVSRLLLGSETQHVLTHGSVPVLVIR